MGFLFNVFKSKALIYKKEQEHPTAQKLRSFLNEEEPKMAKWLVNTWKQQESAITYKELREAYLDGGLTDGTIKQWQTDYAKVVNEQLTPIWENAMKQAVIDANAVYPYYLYEPSVGLMTEYISTKGASLITNLAEDQKSAVQAVLKQASGYRAMSADEVSQAIRPLIGLTKPQAKANLSHYNAIKSALLENHPNMKPENAEKKARESAARYAARQHRYRATTIARTELAAAYNAGHYGATLEAMEKGYLGTMVKTVSTALDERTCPKCSSVENKPVEMDKPFKNGFMLPPFHPNCRCVLMYEQIEKPKVQPETPKPKEVASKPKQTETKPKETEATPVVTTTKPKTTTTKPKATTTATKPKDTTSKPSTTAVTTTTAASTKKPKTTTTKPKATTATKPSTGATTTATATVTTKPKTTKPKTTPKTSPKTGTTLTADDVFGDFSNIPKSSFGTSFSSDSTKVEGQSLTARKIKIGNTEYYEMSGKLTSKSWQEARTTIRQGGHNSYIMFESEVGKQGGGNFSATRSVKNGRDTLAIDSVKKLTSESSIEIYDNDGEYRGLEGYFRVRVPVTTDMAKDQATMISTLKKAGLSDLTTTPNTADELLLKKSKLVWQHDPQTAAMLDGLSDTARAKEIDKTLKKLGFDDDRINSLQWEEVYPGYSTFVDYNAIDTYKDAGLTHVWAGVTRADAVVAISKNGFTATNYRVQSGMPLYGASPIDDMISGGSDNVFTRIGVATQRDRYDKNYLGDDYRIIIKPDIMGRTDWYAYNYDNYGRTEYLSSRMSPETHIKQNAMMYSKNNEIMFRHGITSENFLGISCQTEQMRQTLLNEFKTNKVKQINGVKIEEFVHVSTLIGDDSTLNDKRGIKKWYKQKENFTK